MFASDTSNLATGEVMSTLDILESVRMMVASEARTMFDSAIKAWASETKAALPAEVRTLISQANFDLYYGPSGGGLDDEDSTYPGFTTACRRIREALSDAVPSTLYVDEDDCYSTTEPSAESCGGCEDCSGEDLCVVEPTAYASVDRAVLVRALVGRELAGYVS
jgi:hypothetical protein